MENKRIKINNLFENPIITVDSNTIALCEKDIKYLTPKISKIILELYDKQVAKGMVK